MNKEVNEQATFLNTARFLFLLIATVFGWVMSAQLMPNAEGRWHVIMAFAGFLLAACLVFIEVQIRRAYPKELIVGLIGLVSGLVTASLIANAIPRELFSPSFTDTHYALVRFALHIFMGYFGLVMALRYSSRLDFSGSKLITYDDEDLVNCRILDTSVLIDGRIADIAKSGFLDGTILIPQFVLTELQAIADSSDPLKRKRGRRGLDVVRMLQSGDLPVVIDQRDFPHEPAVDTKLVLLAKKLRGKIVSNDYNLNQVAEIQDVKVLNINDLATALKQVVLPGEDISVYIIKEGKEPQQGVGYLEDGTMVVVEGGQAFLQTKAEVTVTSVLQTAAGKMIFAKVKDSQSVVTLPASYQPNEGGRPRQTRG